LHASDFAFGTALDLCEDVFLRTFDNILLELVPIKGEVVTVEPVLARSGARLLLKTTAFESVQICLNDGEAGPDGKLLRRMGSSAFDVADLGWLWPGNRGRATGEDAQKVLFANVFNTLPVLFETSPSRPVVHRSVCLTHRFASGRRLLNRKCSRGYWRIPDLRCKCEVGVRQQRELTFTWPKNSVSFCTAVRRLGAQITDFLYRSEGLLCSSRSRKRDPKR
jgi:hypothetical protein